MTTEHYSKDSIAHPRDAWVIVYNNDDLEEMAWINHKWVAHCKRWARTQYHAPPHKPIDLHPDQQVVETASYPFGPRAEAYEFFNEDEAIACLIAFVADYPGYEGLLKLRATWSIRAV